MNTPFQPGEYAHAHVNALHAYVPGQQPTGGDWVKLNTNENPFPPSPKVIEAIQGYLGKGGTRLRLYPNPTSGSLRAALASHHSLGVQQVLVGNGCDDILNLLMRVFAGVGKPAGMMMPSYSLYPVLAGIQGAELIEVNFTREMTLDAQAIAASGANLFFLTSPNAPTGVGFSTEAIAAIATALDGILVVDETYAPFASENAVDLLAAHPNLVIARSFSKAYGLAGLRVGYALASPEIIDLLDRVRDSYNLDGLAQAGALAALEDQAYYADVRRKVLAQRETMAAWYAEQGWFCYDSAANFHFVEPKNAAGETGPAVSQSLFDYLNEHRVLVRHFPGHRLTQGFLRVSIGTESEMQRTREVMAAWQTRGV